MRNFYTFFEKVLQRQPLDLLLYRLDASSISVQLDLGIYQTYQKRTSVFLYKAKKIFWDLFNLTIVNHCFLHLAK